MIFSCVSNFFLVLYAYKILYLRNSDIIAFNNSVRDMGELLYYLDLFENLLWGYLGAPVILLLGLYLCLKTRFVQIRKFPVIIKNFLNLFTERDTGQGLHPLKAFFASMGGCIGVGNIVATCTAVQLGGPGALFWIWMTAIVGMIIKYAEVYLGLRYRESDSKGGFIGGPMFFLQRVFTGRTASIGAAMLLCVYGVDVYQFRVVTSAIATNIPFINEQLFGLIFLVLILFAVSGGVKRVSNISSAIIPVFVLLYLGMGLWVLANNLTVIPAVVKQVILSAFSGSALAGGFVGSALLKTLSEGARRGCYSSDIGVGYASMIHSESNPLILEKQASLVMVDIFIDAFMVCTTSIFLILVTGVWQQSIPTEMLVQSALSLYFPYMEIFMPIFLFLVGYSTINAYFCIGIKCAQWLSPRFGKTCYCLYAVASFAFFSFLELSSAQALISIAACLLLVLNGYAIVKLRNEISFNFDGQAEPISQPVLMAEEAVLEEEPRLVAQCQ